MQLSADFYNYVREHVFQGSLTNTQVQALEMLFDAGNQNNQPLSCIAYVMATTVHEAGLHMDPNVVEIGKGAGKAYGKPGAHMAASYDTMARMTPYATNYYYGRSWVQLTWLDNYDKIGRLLGSDLAANPDSALTMSTACDIIWCGMINGTFTGKSLSDYFSLTTHNFVDARRIVNGTDDAAAIAGIANVFLLALQLVPSTSPQVSAVSHAPVAVPAPVVPMVPTAKPNGLWANVKSWFKIGDG